ncbi:MAG: GatB/YqeY domain-containing protein, partial [Anaerolineae bacterium]|nr:GatB/YqeY domain-containing protein [Anaerolineae bacterium]
MEDPRTALQAALKAAMLSKDAIRRDVIRLAMSAIKQVEIDERRELTPEDVVVILQKEVKTFRESIQEWQNAGREDKIAETQRDLSILESFLPQQLSRDEIAALVRDAIAKSGATSVKEMGKVMG